MTLSSSFIKLICILGNLNKNIGDRLTLFFKQTFQWHINFQFKQKAESEKISLNSVAKLRSIKNDKYKN